MKRIFSFSIILIISILSSFSQQKGRASYYSNKFQGRKTSSGIPYHRDSLTCAHKTLPFGTLLVVRNPLNNREVIVKVTDRGPHVRNRIIDLSYAAAKQLDIIRQGVAQIEIKEWKFLPIEPLLIPFDKNGLFIPVKTTEEVYNKLIIRKEKVLR